MSTTAELFTIGQLARRVGVPARTIRFWSDAGLVPPTGRSAAGYRLYDAEAAARLDLVQALRELGLGLDVVQAILSRAITVPEVAAAHVAVLDGQIRALRLRRAVLSTVAKRGNTIEEMLLMHKLARLSAQERQRIIDDFVDGVFRGVDPGAPAMGIARGMRQLPAELPDDPAPEQVDAWIELAELVADEDFRRRARSMVTAGATEAGPAEPAEPGQPGPATRQTVNAVMEHAGQALAEGIAPGSPEGKQVLDRIVPPDTPAADRAALLRQLETFTDARVERYWQLLAVINGQPVPPPAVPGFDWLIAALRADPRRARDRLPPPSGATAYRRPRARPPSRPTLTPTAPALPDARADVFAAWVASAASRRAELATRAASPRAVLAARTVSLRAVATARVASLRADRTGCPDGLTARVSTGLVVAAAARAVGRAARAATRAVGRLARAAAPSAAARAVVRTLRADLTACLARQASDGFPAVSAAAISRPPNIERFLRK